jgi:SagB-type dehydrogenase family enzyme
VGKVNFATFRTVPSGGARHPFETYLAVNRVKGLRKGIYRYLALEHKLIYLFDVENLEDKITEVTDGQSFIGKAAVVFMWSCIPYRSEWRYDIAAHKTLLQDSGHLCQNLYLACEAIGCGTVAVGAYNQKAMDEFLRLDGEDEFVIYVAPVGKIAGV